MPYPHRILICDDEQRIRKSLGGLLQDHDYEVVTASNSTECLKTMATEDFDLVILDIIMPDMDGIEVLARIKEVHKDTEVIMITGYADKDKAIATFRLDAYDFLEKPFESKEILNTIAHCLRQVDLRRDLEEKTRELKESEEKYRRIFDDSKDMIYITTREGRLIDVNKAGVELLGYDSKQELLDIDSVEVLYHNPDDRKPFQERIERDSFVKDYAVEFKKKDETRISVLITSTARKDDQGNVLGYEGIIRDVTEMKMAQKETEMLMRTVREAKEEWEETFDAIEDAIFLVDKTYTIQVANKSLAKLVGKDLSDIVGQRCYKLLHGIDHVPEFCPRPLVVKTCCSQSAELWESNLNRHLRIYYYPIIGKKGEVREVIHVMRDITERQKARQEIEYLASVVRHSQDAIIGTDLNCRVTSWNKAAERIFGYKEEEAVGSFVDIIVPEKQRKECHLFVEEIGEGRNIEHYETTRKTKDGRSIDMDMTLSPIKDSEGDIIGVSFIARDVTYQKELEANLLQAQKMESIGTLAGGIAHDFNNSLMGIQGYASLMLLKTDPSRPHYDMLRKIESQVQNASDLTKQLLGFARGGRYEPKPTNLNELIDRSSEMFGRTRKEIIIHRKFEKDLWTVEADQGQMEQVLLNLYVNAWHAMPGGGSLYIETSNVTLDESFAKPYDVEPGKYAKMSVTDTGAGMDDKTQQRIFDPFFTTKEMGRGTGLGLASVYGIVRNHKGIITVYSEKGYGTTFSVYLPVSEKAITPPTRIAPDKVMKGTETILLVDDEELVLDAARAMLEHLDYTVLVAEGGEEAWALYQENKERIDLVILDMIMPGMGGGEVYDRIKALNPDVKVILSSGYSIAGKASEIIERGANAFIQKPFSITGLSHKIREVI
ncbi:MAG: PAS domain S-box protein [Deltaproteobacteria bacterium]|nr:PAS domain S-box protein [Deltaproteobacteria bacterium]MBW1793542.1 PAS domain S-box protein [Deltaproteobacteria bacterium]